jgi:hypothetical protein
MAVGIILYDFNYLQLELELAQKFQLRLRNTALRGYNNQLF